MLQKLPYLEKKKTHKVFLFFILSNSGLCRHGPGYLHGKNVELLKMKKSILDFSFSNMANFEAFGGYFYLEQIVIF